MKSNLCDGCGEQTPDHDITHYGSAEQGFRRLCTQCFNTDVAARCGLENFENIRLEPIALADCTGELHQFHFQTRLLGHIISLEAFELLDGRPGGYKFQLIGDPEDDLFGLLGRLIERMRRALAVKHLTDDGRLGLQIAEQTVCGRIEWDDAQKGRTPLIVVDGRELTWDEFGEMLMTFEGCPFKLDIRDPSEEP